MKRIISSNKKSCISPTTFCSVIYLLLSYETITTKSTDIGQCRVTELITVHLSKCSHSQQMEYAMVL